MAVNTRNVERRHLPVMLEEVLALLKPRRGRLLVDATFGLGGHAVAMADRGAKVIGLDLDPSAVEGADPRIEIHRANFAGLPTVLAGRRVHGILADLGVSSPQIDQAARGFSYRLDGPLDMRMDPTRGRTAAEVVATATVDELTQALRELGDEEDAERIAPRLVERRPATTRDLVEIVCEARGFTLRRAAGAKLHPAARTFQALRMLVNREPANLERLLAVAPSCLEPGGVVVVISFHSGEDRLVKRAFRDPAYAESGGPVSASEEERRINRRARSARLRWARMAR